MSSARGPPRTVCSELKDVLCSAWLHVDNILLDNMEEEGGGFSSSSSSTSALKLKGYKFNQEGFCVSPVQVKFLPRSDTLFKQNSQTPPPVYSFAFLRRALLLQMKSGKQVQC